MMNDENQERTYNEALLLLNKSFVKEKDVLKARQLFASITGYKDSDEFVMLCDEKRLILQKQEKYNNACQKIMLADTECKKGENTKNFDYIQNAQTLLKSAINDLSTIKDYKDSTKKIAECDVLIQQYSDKISKLNSSSVLNHVKRKK